MGSELVVAAVQMTSVDDLTTNLKQIESLLSEVFSAARPRLVCFPENCLYLRLKEGEKIEGLTLEDAVFSRLKELAQSYQTYLHLGSVPLTLDGALYNSSILVTPEGQVRPTYQKMHLFDIQLEGQAAIRESDVFQHGEAPSIIEVDGWKIGESICYDLRFAELYSQYAKGNVDVLLVPAAFLVRTGEAHWEVLLRARAIESQSYLIASAQGGSHIGLRGGKRETYGNTLMVDPWGAVLGQVQSGKPGMLIFNLTRERIESVRRQIPMKLHRRLPVGS